MSLAFDVAIQVVACAAVGAWLWQLGNWIGIVVGAPTLLCVHLLWPLPIDDDEGCLKCGHAHVHHQGNCQACLRDVVAGVPLSTAVPCDSFRLWSPRTRWERFRGARASASETPAEQETVS
ncbi:hypothetical protein DX116_10755 [Aeromicrobium endophyticum]|uniref:Uncharacterized protein n=1 Tax=Aeromicrobium endophyticum TaxID=2292704 RepID=A0A371P164_9ACTN|nr:hypothetical protein DX116_10755 [Aeromicrobium endophyticum]